MNHRIAALVAPLCAGVVLAAASSAHASQRTCEAFYVPMDVSAFPAVDPSDNLVYAELCRPKSGAWPTVAQLLVHGSTHNHYEFAFPFHERQYSHVELASRAGYATLNIDRLGTVRSSKPHSSAISVDLIVSTLNQLAVMLRTGTLDAVGIPTEYLDDDDDQGSFGDVPGFPCIIYFGASLATGYGWELEHQYPAAADAFVLHGALHDAPLAWVQLVGQHHSFPAKDHPSLGDPTLDYDPDAFDPLTGANTGMGMVTTEPGWHDDFFLWRPGTHQQVPPVDEAVLGGVSSYLVVESALDHALLQQPCTIDGTPNTDDPSESCSILDPVILLVGQYDGAVCGRPAMPGSAAIPGSPSVGLALVGGPPGPGLDCSSEVAIIQAEQPFFNVSLQGNVKLVPDAGHNIHVHDSYADVHDAWLVPRLHALGF
jgi:hypothetical protein